MVISFIDFNKLNIFTKIPFDPYFMFVYRLLGLGLIHLIKTVKLSLQWLLKLSYRSFHKVWNPLMKTRVISTSALNLSYLP